MGRLQAGGLTTALALFLLVLVLLLGGALLPGQTLFSNDGPLGQQMAQCHRMPDRFWGCWLDLNNVGFAATAAAPSITFDFLWIVGPILFSKLYALVSLLTLGLCAWCFLRQSKLSAPACILGGFAAMLNSTFFSVACWGVGAHDITAGMTFLALAALVDTEAPGRWIRAALAGMAVGMAVAEGADVGAIYSLFVAAFILYQMWASNESAMKRVAGGLGRLVLVVLCAGFLAAQSIHGLIDTSILGVKGAQQDVQTKAQRWDWATQWSLSELEMLNLVIPGIFGYRMDDLDKHTYWGTMGRAPALQKYIDNGRQGPRPKGYMRYTGGGNYAGGLVVLLAIWAAAESFRRKNSAFNPGERKWAWFWLGVVVVSLLLALGRYAPFYKYVYALPYFSTIRNPTKFLYPFSMGMAVLFAFGVHALYRRYMLSANVTNGGRRGGWWQNASTFEKGWVWGCIVVGVGLLIGWWQYAASRQALIQYLQGAEVGGSQEAIADYSIQQAGWLVGVFFLGAGLMVLTFSRAFSGRAATVGAVCFGLLLVADLGFANYPWVHIWNYEEKYATNPILETLRDKPYEHRVVDAPLDQSKQFSPFYRLYKIEWMQHEFPQDNIQSFETVEMPRMPLDYAAWAATANNTNAPGIWFHLTRVWQLTSVGYVFGPVTLADYLAHQTFFAQPPLQLVTQFKLAHKPGVTQVTKPDQITAVPDPDGQFALFRFTPGLSRATLFSRWQVTTNGTNVLAQIMDPAFDPRASVFVDGGPPATQEMGADVPAGSVQISSYAPKKMTLDADVKAPAILMTGDHFDPDWKVFVDGRPEKLLQCDFLMRGVQLSPGTHHVEFQYKPSTGWLGISAAAWGVTLVLIGWLVVQKRNQPTAAFAATTPRPTPAPATAPAKPASAPEKRKKSGDNRGNKR